MLSGIEWYDKILAAQWAVERWTRARIAEYEWERSNLRAALNAQRWTRKFEFQAQYWLMWQRIEDRYHQQCALALQDGGVLQSFARHSIFTRDELWHGKSDSKSPSANG